VLFAGCAVLSLYALRGELLFDYPYYGVTLRGDQVSFVKPGGPSETAGLEAGDRVIAVGGSSLERAAPVFTDRFYSGSYGEVLSLTVSGARGERSLVIHGAAPPLNERRDLAASFITGFGFLAIGLFAALQIQGRLTVLFFAVCASFSLVLLPIAPAEPSWAPTVYSAVRSIASVLLPPLLLHFFLVFPKLAPIVRSRPMITRALYAPAALLLAVVAYVFTGLFTNLPGIHALARALSALVMVTLVVYAGLALVTFISGYLRVRSRAERRRYRVVLLGTVLGITPLLAGTMGHLLRPGTLLPGEEIPVISLLLVPMGFAYAIVRYQVLDIEVVIKRGAAFSLLTACLFLIAVGVYAVFGRLLESLTGERNRWIMIATLVVVAVLFSPLRQRIEKAVDRIFFPDRYDERRALRELGQELPGILQIDTLLATVVDKLSRTLRVREVALYLAGGPNDALELAYVSGLTPEELHLPPLSPALLELTRRARRPLRIADVEANLPFGSSGEAEERILTVFQGGVVVPVRPQNELLAILLLGRRGGGESYGFEDLELLQAFAGQAGLGIRNGLVHARHLEQQRISNELAMARDLQRRLLPESDPLLTTLDISGGTHSCSEVGGDFYGYIPLSGGRLGIAVGDVSGHGVPAALLMASLSATLRAEADRHTNPGHVLRALNDRACDAMEPGQFLSVFYAIWDPALRELEYANAGHPAPLVLEPDGTVSGLWTGNLLIGIDRASTYRSQRYVCPAGSVVLLYTDGLTEQEVGGQAFGEERLIDLVRSDGQLSAAGLRQHILNELHRFRPGEPEDDTTLLVLRVL